MRNIAKTPASLHELSNVLVQQLDVTDETSIRDAVEAVESHLGPVDVLLNVAGNVVQGTLEELSLDQVRAQLETNVVGLVAVTKALLPGMRQRRSGHIINFSSGGGLIGVPRFAAYVASKFAVEGLSEALWRDISHLGRQVTIVEPGVFQTGLGESAVQPSRTIDAYARAADQIPGLYDWTPAISKARRRPSCRSPTDPTRHCASTSGTDSTRCAGTTTSVSTNGRRRNTSHAPPCERSGGSCRRRGAGVRAQNFTTHRPSCSYWLHTCGPYDDRDDEFIEIRCSTMSTKDS
jgi:NAD(P)-dependent dehydrogenase (short-subunit alcohol dehydrogenase family)